MVQAAVIRLSAKRAMAVKDSYFDKECRWIHGIFPAGNLYPKSLFLMRKVAGVRDTREIQRHVCVKGCCVFPHLDAGQYRAKLNSSCDHGRCAHCGEKRFEVGVTVAGGVRHA
jgi:hypothetical protein